MARFPFLLPQVFYLLCKEVMGVTHELFSGALSQSGVLPHYCSEDSEDVVFGSSGTWRENEDKVAGGAGILPYGEDLLTKNLFRKFDAKMRSGKPYCRVFFISIEKEGKLFDMLYDEEFVSEVVWLIPSDCIHFLRHTIEIFRQGCNSDSDPSWKPPWKLALVIWMNEAYRVAHPPPEDVEECFTFWAAETFQQPNVVDYIALYRCFPPRTRKLVYKEPALQDFDC